MAAKRAQHEPRDAIQHEGHGEDEPTTAELRRGFRRQAVDRIADNHGRAHEHDDCIDNLPRHVVPRAPETPSPRIHLHQFGSTLAKRYQERQQKRAKDEPPGKRNRDGDRSSDCTQDKSGGDRHAVNKCHPRQPEAIGHIQREIASENNHYPRAEQDGQPTADAARTAPITTAAVRLNLPAATGRCALCGLRRSRSASTASLMKYTRTPARRRCQTRQRRAARHRRR